MYVRIYICKKSTHVTIDDRFTYWSVMQMVISPQNIVIFHQESMSLSLIFCFKIKDPKKDHLPQQLHLALGTKYSRPLNIYAYTYIHTCMHTMIKTEAVRVGPACCLSFDLRAAYKIRVISSTWNCKAEGPTPNRER